MKVVHTQHMRTAVGTDSTQHTTVPHPQAGDGGRSMQTDVVRTTVNTALPKLGSGGSPPALTQRRVDQDINEGHSVMDEGHVSGPKVLGNLERAPRHGAPKRPRTVHNISTGLVGFDPSAKVHIQPLGNDFGQTDVYVRRIEDEATP